MNEMAKRGNSAAQVALAAIQGEPGSKPTWITVAKTAEEIRRSGKWTSDYASPTEWLEAVAEASGYTINTIRRFIASFRFLENQDKRTRELVFDPVAGGGVAMASVELIKRMHDIAPTQANKVLQMHIKKEVKVTEIRDLYDGLVRSAQPDLIITNPPYFAGGQTPSLSAGKLGLRRANQDKKTLTDIVRRQISVLSDTDAVKVFSDRYEFDFVSPDVVAVGQEDFSVSFVDGFEMKKLSGKIPAGMFKKAIAEIVFSATFFRRYWVMLEGAEKDAKSLTSALDQLEASSVGIALIDLELMAIQVHRKPSALPQPDRHALARSAILTQGIPT